MSAHPRPLPTFGLPRRAALAVPPALLALSACGPNRSGDGDGAGGDGSLRFAWWGNEKRDALTNQALELYLEQNEGVSVSAEPTDWGGYWDRLATQIAGGDIPDIIQMDEGYLAEYASRDVLLDLSGTDLETSAFDPAALDAGTVDGGLFAINAGINTPVLLANPAVFEAAGVEMPDDSTWTWDDLVDLASRITEGTEDGTYGVQQIGIQGDPPLSVYLRQLGAERFSDEGIGFTAEHLQQWMELALRLQDTGAAPPADVAVEESGQTVDQSLFAVGRCALQSQWSNQIVTLDGPLDGTVVPLRMPSMTGSAADAQLWYKASMYFSVSASSPNQDAAVALVDWLVNSPDAGRILLAERGIPANLDVREAITGELGASDAKAADFIAAIAEELGDPPHITPPGGSAVGDAVQRAMEDLVFGRADPATASAAAVAEAEAALG